MAMIPTVSTKAAGGNIAATVVLTNALAAGSIFPLELQWNPRVPAAVEIIIPTAESWMLTDLYFAGTEEAGDETNPQVEIKKDNDRLLDTSNKAASLLVTSTQRPNGLHGNLVFEGGSHMTMNVITSTLSTSAHNFDATIPYEKQG